MKGSIYHLTDQTGVPRYVGKTKGKLITRFYSHKTVSKFKKTHKDKWIQKVGKENIKIVLIEEYSLDILNEMEIYWIAEYKKLGYKLTNHNLGGDGGTGTKHTQETRNKISESHKGIKHTPETITNIALKNTGRKNTESTKQKMSIASKGKSKTDEHKANISKSKMGKCSESQRLTLLNNSLNQSVESRLKISNSLIGNTRKKGKKDTEETKYKKSLSQRKKWSIYYWLL